MTNVNSINQCKERVMNVVRKLMKANINPLTQGNISCRDTETGLVIITPHDYPYEIMTVDDLVVLDIDGNVVEGKRVPSCEAPVHLSVYKKRPKVNGVVHTEPIYTNAFGIAGRPIEPCFVNMGICAGGAVPIMPFEDSGSYEFAEKMLKLMEGRNAIVWACHGLLTVGPTVEDAFKCTVMVEQGAQINYVALSLGTPYVIGQKKLDQLISLKEGE